jgi:hypothetical protein
MARILSLTLGGHEFGVNPVKVDRTKLYGRTETVALDDSDNPCELVAMDRSGTLIIPRGGLGMGALADDGTWADRSELIAVGADGSPVPVHPSSYDTPVGLDRKVSADELLECNITAVYQLDDASAELTAAVGSDIYTFDYFYRAGHTGSQAFLLASGDAVFMLLGQASPFELLGLDAAAEVLELADDDADIDDLDFSMM